jgi:glycerol-3-phosphate cytidylyltransferase
MKDDLFLEEYTQKLLDSVCATLRNTPPKCFSSEHNRRQIIKEINKLEDESLTVIKKSREGTVKIGITFGAFDLFHAGHVCMLEDAKTVCDHLIVGLHTDPTIDRPDIKNKPVQNIIERQLQLKGCKYVNEIILYDTEDQLIEILKTVKWDVRILGEEYSQKDFTGKEFCNESGGTLYYNKRKHELSSSSLRERILRAAPLPPN